jgi:hypothetical protein
MIKATHYLGEIKRYVAVLRCTSHPNMRTQSVLVFAPSKRDARQLAIDKIKANYERHMDMVTEWKVVTDPTEA